MLKDPIIGDPNHPNFQLKSLKKRLGEMPQFRPTSLTLLDRSASPTGFGLPRRHPRRHIRTSMIEALRTCLTD